MQTHPEKDLIYTGLTSLTVLTLLNETSKISLTHKRQNVFSALMLKLSVSIKTEKQCLIYIKL